MERDLNPLPGLKLAGCVGLLIAAVAILAYPVTYSLHSWTSPLKRNGTIDFYGKVVDPQGGPISGVTLSANVKSYGLFRGHFQKQFEIESDDDGRFHIAMGKANSMRLENFSKEGYTIRGRPAKFKGLRSDILEHWYFTFRPNSKETIATSFEDPFTFVMDPPNWP